MIKFREKLDQIYDKHQLLEKEINSLTMDGNTGKEFVEVSKEYAKLGKIVSIIEEYKKIEDNILQSEEMLRDTDLDQEMKALAEEEYQLSAQQLEEKTQELKISLLHKDEADSKSAILEIRAGTGGEEAALFAAELYRMYQRFAELEKWKFEVLTFNETDIGGISNATIAIKGDDVFGKLKFEAGGHRVQRVPVTESGGRIHTSAATVAVLPEADEVDIEVREEDLRVDTYRSQGAGGQHVNTTDSAVRITHLPTSIVVTCQDEKSQHKNRARAMRILRARLYEEERQKRDQERSSHRKAMIGSGDRSERIRTYNYPQGRVSDHRINLTLHKLPQILAGDALQEVIHELIQAEQLEQLAVLESQ